MTWLSTSLTTRNGREARSWKLNTRYQCPLGKRHWLDPPSSSQSDSDSEASSDEYETDDESEQKDESESD